MHTLTIRDIPDDLYTDLKYYAEMNRRSLNSQIIACIERTVRSRNVHTDEVIARARRLREKTRLYPITDQEFNAAKRIGRE